MSEIALLGLGLSLLICLAEIARLRAEVDQVRRNAAFDVEIAKVNLRDAQAYTRGLGRGLDEIAAEAVKHGKAHGEDLLAWVRRLP